MIRIQFFTFLLVPLFYLPLAAHKPFPTPPPPAASMVKLAPAVFRHASQSTSLRLEVFTAEGESVPATIYRFRQGDQIIYETGAELRKGLYLIKLTDQEEVHLFKLMKMD
jgi:Tfp pilus assembly protein FimV